MKRVLVIAYLFPPIVNSGTRRSLTFVNRLPDHGWRPTVVSLAASEPDHCDEQLLKEIREGTRVERVSLGARIKARHLATFLPRDWRQKVETSLAWRLQNWTAVPDEAGSWRGPAIDRGVELFHREGFDLVYASGWPWTAFLAAKAIAKKVGVPYVLDYRDIWKPSGTHLWEHQTRVQSWANPALERLAGKGAAAVITVTPTLVDRVRQDAGVQHVHCITNGYEPEDFEGDFGSPDAATVRISYTGVWRTGYGLETLYRAVRKLADAGSSHVQRLRIDAAGFRPGMAEKFNVGNWVHEHGLVPHAQAVTLMMQSTALYLPVPEGYYAMASLPGKMFEYMGSQRPILAEVPATSEVARVLDHVGGAHRVDPGDVDSLAAVLDSLCRNERSGVFTPQRKDRLVQYSRASTAKQLAAVFDASLQGRGMEPLT